jgi:hypothetical protein
MAKKGIAHSTKLIAASATTIQRMDSVGLIPTSRPQSSPRGQAMSSAAMGKAASAMSRESLARSSSERAISGTRAPCGPVYMLEKT